MTPKQTNKHRDIPTGTYLQGHTYRDIPTGSPPNRLAPGNSHLQASSPSYPAAHPHRHTFSHHRRTTSQRLCAH
eukprot:366340-Chlamydomonas_euryale.AAC.2